MTEHNSVAMRNSGQVYTEIVSHDRYDAALIINAMQKRNIIIEMNIGAPHWEPVYRVFDAANLDEDAGVLCDYSTLSEILE